MPKIEIITTINASLQRVFDLSRDIDLHQISMTKSKELAVGGRTSGLIEKGETVQWEGKHFGCYLTHTSLITEMNPPYYFVDEMTEGYFKYYRHDHYFTFKNEQCEMMDLINYEAPFGFLGKLFDAVLLNTHLTHLITQRNKVIKRKAENNEL
ncbi:SRPBCC family protein [Parvicella tangerina]|uniref:Cell division protein n=1 Tax=Parvicella tangerina TaxID=2829795 RepID=A0A916NH98_9FLAO|nr:SRPBCC family protein [Parvicella tangerina]CAG5081095.1 hypothetical protein CRYO30217_01535 [Parvicella tangerina]